MEDAAATAQHIVDISGAQSKAEVVSAFYLRLREMKIPAAVAREFTTLEFYAHDDYWEDED